jgi:hypothetical protein
VVRVVVCCCMCYLVTVSSASAASRLAFKGTRYAKVSHACSTPKPGSATCLALVRVPVSSVAAGESGVRPYTAGDGALESGPAGGLTPTEIAGAYGFQATAGGAGQTLAIVDAYDDPNIESDLAVFDAQYGIAACTTTNGCFTKVSQTGSTTSLPDADTSGWSVEITLDVEVAHSTCPRCKIVLVEADTPTYKNLAAAVDEAVAMKATEISNSYGGPEGELGSSEKSAYDHPGIVIAAAAGDEGYYDWTPLNAAKSTPELPNMPASLPSVIAVGGTTLELDEAGTRASETVWNGNERFDESKYAEGATGGGCSTRFSAPTWQLDTPGFAATGCGDKRLTADVAAVGDPNTGFDIYDSYACGKECESFKRGAGWLTVGGTSLSTPLVSALYALAGGSNGVGYPALTLYGHLGDSSALYDVTEGGNGFCDDDGLACGADAVFEADVDCEGSTACNAAPGYDGPSGVGTPNSLGLFEPLRPTATITLPNSPKAGVGASFTGAASSDPYPGGSLVSYSWNWGDGTPESSGVAPTHTYVGLGEYLVTLTVTDSYGLTSTPAVQHVDVVAKTAQELEQQEEANASKTREAEAKQREAAANEHALETEQRETEVTADKKREEEAAARSSTGLGGQGVSGFKTSLTPEVPDARLASTSLQVRATGVLTLRISCPAGESNCSGSVSLRALGAVGAGHERDAHMKPSVLTLAAGSFSVPGGKVRTVTLHLSQQARALLAHARTLRARVTLLAHDLGGASHTTQTLVRLHAPAEWRRDS